MSKYFHDAEDKRNPSSGEFALISSGRRDLNPRPLAPQANLMGFHGLYDAKRRKIKLLYSQSSFRDSVRLVKVQPSCNHLYKGAGFEIDEETAA